LTLNENDLLFKYSHEKDGKVRKKILEQNAKQEQIKSIPLYVEALKDPVVENKAIAIKSLGELGAIEAIKPLIEMTQYRLEIQGELISNIVKIAKDVDLKYFVEYLKEGNINVRKSIPIILGKIGNRDAIPLLINLLKDKNSIIRVNSVKALGKLTESHEIDIILQVFEDGDEEVRKAAIFAISDKKNMHALNPLLKLLKDKNKTIRKCSARAIFKLLKETQHLKTLYRCLKSKNRYERREVVKLLGLIGNSESIKYLIKILNSRDGNLRNQALKSIIKISKKINYIDNSLILALSAKEWQIRSYCAKIIGLIGNETITDNLLNLMKDSKSIVRRNATKSLAKIGSNKIIPIVIKCLRDPDWRVRRSSVDLLRKIGSPEAISPLINSLKDDDIYVKTWAIKALGNLKDDRIINALSKLLDDQNSRIRLSVVKALAKIKDKNSINYLIKALGDDDFEVRKEIEKALYSIEPNWMDLL